MVAKKSKKSSKTKRVAKKTVKTAPKLKPAKKAITVKAETPQKPDENEAKRMEHVVKILSDANVRQNLIEIGGENALAMVRTFHGNYSDDELAKKLKIKISDVRATLNKLHNEGLVNYLREKDSETGWYSYSWSLNHQRIEKWAVDANKLNIGSGSDEYYYCPSCGSSSIINFESAAHLDFRCEQCNRLLEFIDEKKMASLYEKK